MIFTDFLFLNTNATSMKQICIKKSQYYYLIHTTCTLCFFIYKMIAVVYTLIYGKLTK